MSTWPHASGKTGDPVTAGLSAKPEPPALLFPVRRGAKGGHYQSLYILLVPGNQAGLI